MLFERFDNEAANVGIVVDHQHRFGRCGGFGRRFFGRGFGFGLGSVVGLAEQQPDHGAFALAAFDPRRAARLARHAIDHAEAEAGALADFLGGEEGLERALGDLGRHAEPGVGDGQLDIVSVWNVGIGLDPHRAAGEAQHAAVGHGVAGVDREVEHRDLELGRVGHHRHHRVVEVEALLDPRAEHVAQQRPHVLDQRRDVRRPDLEPLHPAEREQLAGQPGTALGGGEGIVGIALELGVRRALGDDVEPADDDRQQIVEVVRDAAGQLPQRLHLLALAKLLLRGLQLGDVARLEQQIDDLPRLIADRLHRHVEIGGRDPVALHLDLGA